MNTLTTALGTACALTTTLALACPPDDCTPRQLDPTVLQAADVQIDVAPLPDAAGAHSVDLAICLDTSGSMDGLIESAKQKLWAIVNDLALAEPTPSLRVALVTFGNDGHNPENGWTFVQTDFTEDLDLVSEKLFALTTNGGTELVGRALHVASELDWASDPSALRIAVVAGNESADQDRERDYRDVCKALIERDIIVNAIYCGDANDQIAPGWRDVAMRSDGRFASIDQNGGTVAIETPFDEQLSTMSASLNTTYIPIGAAGQAAAENQWAQDDNAAGVGRAAAAARACSKAGALYKCSSWDLVDACADDPDFLETVKDEDLPEAMRAMTLEARAAHVARMAADRAKIQKDIEAATKQRQEFIVKEMARQGLDESSAFDAAIRAAIRAQATAKGLQFTEPEPVEIGSEAPVSQPETEGPAAPQVEQKQVVVNENDGC